MNAQVLMLPLMLVFVNCFTKPGFKHFQNFIIAHAALFGLQHCVTEVMRLTQVHTIMHWTTPYTFLRKGRWSCKKVSQCLLALSVPDAEKIEAEPWWSPSGPPAVGRLRRAFYKALRISPGFHSDPKPDEIMPLKPTCAVSGTADREAA